jgi:hydrogenase expression/formation protein HypC
MCLGVPAEVVAIPDPAVPRARVSIEGVERVISTDLLLDEPIAVGDWVLVHVGFAMSRIDAEEAALTLDQIKRLGTFEDELDSFASTAEA